MPEDSAKLDDQGSIVRVPGRAAQMVKDRGRNRPIQHVEFRIVLSPAQDLEIGSVWPDGVDRPDDNVSGWSGSQHNSLFVICTGEEGWGRRQTRERTKQNGNPC